MYSINIAKPIPYNCPDALGLCAVSLQEEPRIALLAVLQSFISIKCIKIIICSQDVALDMVELTYREQYFSRADMYRLRNNSLVCDNFMINFSASKMNSFYGLGLT